MENTVMTPLQPTLFECELLGIPAETLEPEEPTPESAGLGPLRGGGFCIGSVHGVNDGGARLTTGVTLTDDQLGQLARYYLEEIYRLNFDWEAFGQTGSYEIRMLPFARARLASIQDAMGIDQFAKATAEIIGKWEKTWDADVAKARQQYYAETLLP